MCLPAGVDSAWGAPGPGNKDVVVAMVAVCNHMRVAHGRMGGHHVERGGTVTSQTNASHLHNTIAHLLCDTSGDHV